MNRIATPDAIARPTFAVDAAANVLRRPVSYSTRATSER
jgi:hypothetical protein